jgi:glycosyltransferase involved in cell wall biosynthesis
MANHTDAPRVSIVIPAYRASRDIATALDSVFAQTFADFEVIVVNDGSPDSVELEAALQPYRARIRYVTQDNRSAGAARNHGIGVARGACIALLDADDRWMPEFLRQQMSHLDAHPECDLVYCDAILTGDSPLAGRRFMEMAPSSGEVTLHSLIAQRSTIIPSTVVVRRAALVSVGLFDESLRRGQDFELALRMAHHGATIQYQRHVLVERRLRADRLPGDAITQLQRAIAVLERFGRGTDLGPSARTAVRVRLMALADGIEIEQGKRRLLEGNFAAARYHLAAPRRQPVKLRLARVALRVAPRLVRSCCLWLRPTVWNVHPATS